MRIVRTLGAIDSEGSRVRCLRVVGWPHLARSYLPIRAGRSRDTALVLRLTATDATVVITELQASKIQFWLLEFIPAMNCDVVLGPGVQVLVPHRSVHDLTPALRSRVEAIVGCSVRVDELPD